MSFVKFTGTRGSGTPRASISKSGMIALNEAARRKFTLDACSFCVLYYDATTQRIGIRPTMDASAEGAKRLRQRETGCDLAGVAFLNFFGIPYDKTTSYPVAVAEDGILAIDLTKARVRGKPL